MSDAAIIAVSTSIPGTIAAIAAALIAWSNRKSTQAVQSVVQAAQKETKTNIQGVHDLVNSKMTEMLDAARAVAHALGVDEGRRLALVESQVRVAERERVEDRTEEKKREAQPAPK